MNAPDYIRNRGMMVRKSRKCLLPHSWSLGCRKNPAERLKVREAMAHDFVVRLEVG